MFTVAKVYPPTFQRHRFLVADLLVKVCCSYHSVTSQTAASRLFILVGSLSARHSRVASVTGRVSLVGDLPKIRCAHQLLCISANDLEVVLT